MVVCPFQRSPPVLRREHCRLSLRESSATFAERKATLVLKHLYICNCFVRAVRSQMSVRRCPTRPTEMPPNPEPAQLGSTLIKTLSCFFVKWLSKVFPNGAFAFHPKDLLRIGRPVSVAFRSAKVRGFGGEVVNVSIPRRCDQTRKVRGTDHARPVVVRFTHPTEIHTRGAKGDKPRCYSSAES